MSDPSLVWDEARHLARLVLGSVGGGVSWEVFLREIRFWWDVALEGGPRRRALKRLQRLTAFPWPGGKPAEPTRRWRGSS